MISLIIPHVPSVPGANESLEKAVKGWNADEVIIVSNDGTGYGKAVNLGLKLAKGDTMVISNNDVYRIDGHLLDFEHVKTAIQVPLINPEPRDNLPRAFFSVSRKIYEYIVSNDGFFFDERFNYYFEDDDLHKRLKLYNIPVFRNLLIEVYHKDGGGMTCKFFGEQSGFDESQRKFKEKWG